MSSGGWEVVCRNREDSSNNGKASNKTKGEKKNTIFNPAKLEDILPLNQVKSLYDSLDRNNENKKLSKEKNNKSKENEEKKKQQKLKQQQADKNKKQQQQQQQKPNDSATPKAPKSVAGINGEEINELLKKDRTKFPDAPLIWLKDLVSYLDAKAPPEKDDPNFQSKPDTYPLSLVPKAVRAILEKTIKSAGTENAQLCWEGTLTTMVRNISNGTSDTGCKIFLQLLAQTNPEMTIANLQKLASLRNSYQNKKPIGLSLLWAFAQSGKKNLHVGLTVWHEIMAPMLESRNYAPYVVQILNEFLTQQKNSFNVSADRYFDIVDDVYSGKVNFSGPVEKELALAMQNLRSTVLKSELIERPKFFESLLAKVTPKTNNDYTAEMIRTLVDCLAADNRCLAIWTSLYPKNLYPSDLLLKRLLADWNTLRSSLDVKALKETLETFSTSVVTSKRGKDENLIRSHERTSQALVEKMSATKKRESSFPWKKGSIILLVLIGAVVTFDCHKHGSFEASSTGKFLNSSGVANYGRNAWSTIIYQKDRSLGYLEANYPVYYGIAKDYSEKYCKLFGDLFIIARNLATRLLLRFNKYIAEKKPLVIEKFEQYFPGLVERIQELGLIGIEHVKTYSAMASEQIIVQSTTLVKWLETSVFVGKLSPENLRGYAGQAVESTQNLASQTYDWVYEKVQTLSKVQ